MRLLDRQGLLKGDLNILQQNGLAWVLGYESQQMVDFEKYRTINTGLVTNPATSKGFLKRLLDEQEPQTIHESSDEWMTPQSLQDIEAFLQQTVT